MAKEKLFPKPPVDPDAASHAPHKHFDEVATKIFSTPKSTVDLREAKWQADRKRKRRTRRAGD